MGSGATKPLYFSDVQMRDLIQFRQNYKIFSDILVYKIEVLENICTNFNNGCFVEKIKSKSKCLFIKITKEMTKSLEKFQEQNKETLSLLTCLPKQLQIWINFIKDCENKSKKIIEYDNKEIELKKQVNEYYLLIGNLDNNNNNKHKKEYNRLNNISMSLSNEKIYFYNTIRLDLKKLFKVEILLTELILLLIDVRVHPNKRTEYKK